jgi:hypothetical protein
MLEYPASRGTLLIADLGNASAKEREDLSTAAIA